MPKMLLRNGWCQCNYANKANVGRSPPGCTKPLLTTGQRRKAVPIRPPGKCLLNVAVINCLRPLLSAQRFYMDSPLPGPTDLSQGFTCNVMKGREKRTIPIQCSFLSARFQQKSHFFLTKPLTGLERASILHSHLEKRE